jgi:hypothetical protein
MNSICSLKPLLYQAFLLLCGLLQPRHPHPIGGVIGWDVSQQLSLNQQITVSYR